MWGAPAAAFLPGSSRLGLERRSQVPIEIVRRRLLPVEAK
jgi:hypothetical protein